MSVITAQPARTRSSARRGAHRPGGRLGGYRTRSGAMREIVALSGVEGSTLLVDRIARNRGDARLIAQLDRDEPDGNAHLIARMYLADPSRGRCRRLTAPDLRRAPARSEPSRGEQPAELRTRDGAIFRIECVAGCKGSQLRWTRTGADGERRPVSVRHVVGTLEAYEPALILTRRAIEDARDALGPRTDRLRGEMERLSTSRIVLNRGLREAVLAQIGSGQLTFSEIAARCGRVKLDHRGKSSGETSWLARRIGLRPDGSTGLPTPWVRSEVLALIARQGLGVCPHEVEL